MVQGYPERDYDRALLAFAAEREQIAASQARMWHTNVIAAFLALVIFIVGINFDGGQFTEIANGLLTLTFDGEPMGLAIATWLISGIALSFMVYSQSRVLYFRWLSDWVASKFLPDQGELLDDGEGPSSTLATLRSRLYRSLEHVVTRNFLEEEYRDYHGPQQPEGRGRVAWKFIKTLVEFLFGGRWISMDPRVDEEPPHRYLFMATLWPHALLRSVSLGFFWASVGAIFITRGLGSHPLSNVFLVVAAAFFIPYFVQFITFWGRIEKLSEKTGGDEVETTPRVPYTCPNCQAAVIVGKNCEVCGQPIDWSGTDRPPESG